MYKFNGKEYEQQDELVDAITQDKKARKAYHDAYEEEVDIMRADSWKELRNSAVRAMIADGWIESDEEE